MPRRPPLLLAATALLVLLPARPSEAFETGKYRYVVDGRVRAIRAADLDADGRADLVLLTQPAEGTATNNNDGTYYNNENYQTYYPPQNNTSGTRYYYDNNGNRYYNNNNGNNTNNNGGNTFNRNYIRRWGRPPSIWETPQWETPRQI